MTNEEIRAIALEVANDLTLTQAITGDEIYKLCTRFLAATTEKAGMERQMTPEAKAYCEAQAHRIAELEFDNANLKAVIDRLHLDYKELEQQRDELLAAGEKAVSEMKATAWDEEGYLLDPDLDEAADSFRAAALAKVKPITKEKS